MADVDAVIAGLGLIGGSLGKALRRAGWRIGFVDPAVSAEEARSAGAADEKLEVLDGRLIVVATPADTALDLLESLAGSRAVVTSVCGTMAPLRAAARDVEFVAGHPFAGSEKTGLGSTDADLFAGRTWFVDRARAEVTEMIAAVGAEEMLVDAAEHDRLMALTSHLPQALATALGAMLADVDPRFIGSGARSMLRLAGSSHEVWRPLFEQNEANISAAAEELWRVLRRLGPAEFERARELYRRDVRRIRPESSAPPAR